ncbi:hypothetical protein MPTA5024_24465 [Microbispora sp. ATCC PTA-5024]|nr:hypothetical protein MPTA5024_24465 [Microbispora sp. ATCC PTA-5024]
MLVHRLGLSVIVVWAALVASAGLVDSVSASTLPGRVQGGLLTLIGAYAAGSLVRAWRLASTDHRRRAAVGAGLALLLCVYLGYEVSTDFSGQTRVLAVAALTVVAALTAGVVTSVNLFVLARSGAGGRSGSLRDVWAGPGATVVAALVALPLSWYSVQYVPDTAVPTVSIASSLETGRAAKGGAVPVVARITLRNTATTSVRILGSMYQVTGTPATVTPGSDPASAPERLEAALRENYGPAARYNAFARYGQAELIQFGQVVTDAAVLIPDEETTATVVVFVPRDRLRGRRPFALLRLTVDLVFARTDRIPLGPPVEVDSTSATGRDAEGCDGLQVLQKRWPVVYGSLTERLTQSDREVTIGRVIGPPSAVPSTPRTIWWQDTPSLNFSIHHWDKPCGELLKDTRDESDLDLERRSMLDEAGSVTELVPA